MSLLAAFAGLGAWLSGSGAHLRGGFEGEGRDLSVLYIELPLMVLGIPAAALAASLLAGAALGGRAGRRGRAAASGLAALVVAAVLTWVCAGWLDATSPVRPQEGLLGPGAGTV
ncbi:hypothetical protein [Streptomyces lycii]|uniref:ABC transporter permease n=1 Tax=Streptomyces lycii TaxID=2654337 RepID=A0ABQ7FHV4_9ACTN|nr:hypothetical protein [Streptomyces lycii]KAF4408235.1 hypothetical protein GCU69_15475 [Streptomyces lycii]